MAPSKTASSRKEPRSHNSASSPAGGTISSETAPANKRHKKVSAKAQQAMDDIHEAAEKSKKKAHKNKTKKKAVVVDPVARDVSNRIAELERQLASRDALIQSSTARVQELETTNSQLQNEVAAVSRSERVEYIPDVPDGSIRKPKDLGRVGPASLMGLDTKHNEEDRATYDLCHDVVLQCARAAQVDPEKEKYKEIGSQRLNQISRAAAEKQPYLRRFVGDWATHEILKQYVGNARGYRKNKNKKGSYVCNRREEKKAGVGKRMVKQALKGLATTRGDPLCRA